MVHSSIGRGLIFASMSVLCWGTMFPVGRVVFKNDLVSPLTLVPLRFFVGGVIMLLISLIITPRKTFSLRKTDWLYCWILGSFGASLHILLLFFAQKGIPAVNASMIEAWVPILIFFLSFISGKHLLWIQWLGVSGGFLGCLLVLQVLNETGFHINSVSFGDVLILASAICWAGYTVCGRSLIQRLGGWIFTTWSILLGSLWLLPMMYFYPSAAPVPTMPLQWLVIIYFAIIPTVLGFLCWNIAQTHLPLALLSFFAYFNPLVAAVCAWLFLGETLTVAQICGAIVVFTAVLIEPEAGEALFRSRKLT